MNNKEKMSKSYCMNCKKEVEENIKECECGSKFFVYGYKFTLGKNGIICNCGSDKFTRNMHMNYVDKSVNNYVCIKCKNSIGTEYYRNEEDMYMYL